LTSDCTVLAAAAAAAAADNDVVMMCFAVRCWRSVDVGRCDSQRPRQCRVGYSSCQYRRPVRIAQRRTMWRSAV